MPIFGVDGKFKSQFLVNFSDNFLVLMGNCFLIFESFSSQFIWSILMPIFGVDRKLQILIFESFSSQFIWSIFSVSTPFFFGAFLFQLFGPFSAFQFQSWFFGQFLVQLANVQHPKIPTSLLNLIANFLSIFANFRIAGVEGSWRVPISRSIWMSIRCLFLNSQNGARLWCQLWGIFFVFFQIFSPNLLFYFIFWLSFLLFPTNFDGII